VTGDPPRAVQLEIEIAVARPAAQRLLRLQVPVGTTVEQALQQAAAALGVDAPQPDQPVGVWGSVVAPARVLAAGDRIEIYRPLPADPKETRRRLARQGRTMGSRGAL